MMKRLTAPLVAVIALLVLALPVSAKDTWLSVRSKNFLLIGNASEKEIRQVGTRLEQFRYVFMQLFPKANLNTPVPTTVIVFKNDSSYKPFKPLYQGKTNDNIAGYFQQGEDVNYITLTTEARPESPYGVIFHEYTHLLVGNNMSDPPVWFNEGLAEYYSTFDVSDGNKKITLGKPISNHVYLLRERFIPLADLLRVTHDSPAYNERDKSGIFYAESWALVHYLLQGDKGQRVAQLAKFSALLSAGKTLDDSFQQAFQMDYKTMEGELRKYVQRSTYPGTIFELAQPLEFDTEMQTKPLSEAEAQAYLGDLLYHTNRADDSEAYLKQALTLAPDLPLAEAALGRVRVHQKRYDEARKLLEQAVKADPQNYLAHFYLAEALNRQALGPDNVVMQYPADVAATMRAELKKAIELNPNFPEAYHLLAFLDLVNGEELMDATVAMTQARLLRPERLQYALTLARVYFRRQQFDAARHVLEQVMRSGNADAQIRAEAQGTLQQVNSYAEQVARAKAANEEFQRSMKATDTAGAEQTGTGKSEVSTTTPDAPQPIERARPILKRRTDGEQIRGVLVKIECTGGASATLYVQAGARLYKLHSDALDHIEFVSYVPDMSGQISCGPLKQETYVNVTFHPAPQQPRAKFDGEVVAVEFISKEMEIEK
jgi:tetratricopeptide (TPR) repeat protein